MSKHRGPMIPNSERQMPPVQQPSVDLAEAEDVTCESCGNYTFVDCFLMKKISALMSPTGKQAIVPIPTFSCNACGHINHQFLPVIPGSNRSPEKTNASEETLPTDAGPLRETANLILER